MHIQYTKPTNSFGGSRKDEGRCAGSVGEIISRNTTGAKALA